MSEYIIARSELSATQRAKIDLYGGSELIRCKDCKAFNRFDSIINGRIGEHGACLILVAKGTAFGDSIVHETHYCGWAERKEE